MQKVTPRYSCIFIRRFCPRDCGYCLAKDIRGDGKILKPQQWVEALRILESHGVVFHLILGNELLSYPHCDELVKGLKEFYGRYAMYSTFPQPWTDKFLDKCIDAGLYNISGGVDVWPGLSTGDADVDDKSDSVLKWLTYCKDRGVPDVQATITIHRHNYDKLEPLLDLTTKKGIWVGLSMVEYSIDGKHDFYKGKEAMEDWLIPEDERGKFRDVMYDLAAKVRSGRWMVQLPPKYFEELADREFNQTPWHCTEPILIHIEEDGALRACNYRGPLKEKASVFDLGPGGGLTMDKYIELQQSCTTECPGCGGGGGAWSYWWMGEEFQKLKNLGDPLGDKVFQTHLPGYEFEKRLNELQAKQLEK